MGIFFTLTETPSIQNKKKNQGSILFSLFLSSYFSSMNDRYCLKRTYTAQLSKIKNEEFISCAFEACSQ